MMHPLKISSTDIIDAWEIVRLYRRRPMPDYPDDKPKLTVVMRDETEFEVDHEFEEAVFKWLDNCPPIIGLKQGKLRL